jgi:hypothetical protein
MLELMVTAARSPEYPTISFNQPIQILASHARSLGHYKQ